MKRYLRILQGYLGNVRRPWGACWMVAEGGEGENPLLFCLQPQNAGGGGGGGRGRGPGPHLRSRSFRRHPRLRQFERFGGFCGEKAPGPWWAGPQAPWRPGPQAPGAWIPPLSLAGFPSSLQHFRCWAGGPQASGDLANKPLSPASRQEFQKCPGAHRLMKSLACCTD